MNNNDTMGVVAQVKTAFRANNRLAAVIGAFLGGFVPVATYTVAHYEHSGKIWALPSALVLGGLLYSALTVFQWARKAFQSPVKAVGFVLLIEGTMVVSQIQWLSVLALVYLVGINAIATGCVLALEKRGRRAASKTKTKTTSKRGKVVNVAFR